MMPLKAKPSSPSRPEEERTGATDAQNSEHKHEPLRQCIATREHYPKEVMIRFVADPQGALVPDLHARLPGRGAWVIADRPAIETAVRKKLFARAMDSVIDVPGDLSDRVEALLSRRCLDLAGQALGAGQLLLGSGAVHSAARRGEVTVAIAARDGAPDGRRKLLAALKAGGLLGPALNRGKAMIVGCFSSEELSLALGRQNVIHAALPEGGFATRLVAEARRLEGFRPLIPDTWTQKKGPAVPGAAPDA